MSDATNDATASNIPDPHLADTDEGYDDPLIAEPPHQINWNLLNADDAEVEWLELNRWVDWLRHTYGLPASVIPPAWYTHPELLWELSALHLHLHWLCAYDPEQNGSAPLGWHRKFADARQRLREWVAASGTKLDHDRPTRQTVWPGEEPANRSRTSRSSTAPPSSCSSSWPTSPRAVRPRKRSTATSTPTPEKCHERQRTTRGVAPDAQPRGRSVFDGLGVHAVTVALGRDRTAVPAPRRDRPVPARCGGPLAGRARTRPCPAELSPSRPLRPSRCRRSG